METFSETQSAPDNPQMMSSEAFYWPGHMELGRISWPNHPPTSTSLDKMSASGGRESRESLEKVSGEGWPFSSTIAPFFRFLAATFSPQSPSLFSLSMPGAVQSSQFKEIVSEGWTRNMAYISLSLYIQKEVFPERDHFSTAFQDSERKEKISFETIGKCCFAQQQNYVLRKAN